MKRSTSAKDVSPPKKRKREPLPAYEAQEQRRDASGRPIWPAPQADMDNARRIIMECAESKQTTVIAPDKDADGLAAARILHLTLLKLGVPADKLHVHLLQRGNTVHDAAETEALAQLAPSYLFVLDQGSRASPPLVPAPCTTLVIDHHHALASDFPAASHHVSACDWPPVATASLLTYEICKPLHQDVQDGAAWLCAVGTHGDLGAAVKWSAPFPDMRDAFRRFSKKAVTDAVALVNAPRRHAEYNVRDAWEALRRAEAPAQLLEEPALLRARADVRREEERCAHAAPRFAADASVAVLRIASRCQVHNVIATRWAGFLDAKKLRYVLVANEGFMDGMVNFSCRPTRAGRARGEEVNIIEELRALAARHESGDLLERMGASFARGHTQASGGIVPVREFEELMSVLGEGAGNRGGVGRGQGEAASPKKTSKFPAQRNTLGNYFGKRGQEA